MFYKKYLALNLVNPMNCCKGTFQNKWTGQVIKIGAPEYCRFDKKCQCMSDCGDSLGTQTFQQATFVCE